VHATVEFVRVAPSRIDRLLVPLHRWVWLDAHRRGRKLLSFAETEDAGGRDICRAAELTSDPLLRRLYLRHAADEHRHAELFRARGAQVLQGLRGTAFEANWLAPGERGLDQLGVEGRPESAILAFLHLSEKAAAGRFALYQSLLGHDAGTREVFSRILEDEVFHMNYTRNQLARIEPRQQGLRLWQSRLGRIWKAYLRLAVAIASLFGTLLLRIQYFVLLPVFAWFAQRSMRRELEGFSRPRGRSSLTSQY
jgi:hypothetical protein